ncbi:peptidylprolyl isomerase [Pseudoflavitalea rhizosphaerae]|uniref:peptidylprolyl isomerase n=1 Tax=Pseudoflavitalea rhizosphaerae TaxID=1884793 RepID=UPI000F8CC3B5|nr:peptidylprolyl isomerase [Pseudoflavitalea rhizosphaerae]
MKPGKSNQGAVVARVPVSDGYSVASGDTAPAGGGQIEVTRREAGDWAHPKYWWQLIVAVFLFVGCSSGDSKHPRVEISTRQGDIIIELYPDKAPKSVAAFLSYIEKDLYNNASFYRVLNDENQPSNAAKANLVQGGLYRSKKRPELPGIPHESTKETGILHKDGVVSLARTDPGTATSEFFICIGDQPGFDAGGANNADGLGYAAFGRVVKGLDIVRKIYNQPEYDQYFDPPVPIYNIKKL